jgi:hypothetical protein
LPVDAGHAKKKLIQRARCSPKWCTEEDVEAMTLEWKLAARDIVTSLGLLASVVACSGPAVDGDPDFNGPQPFGGNPVGGSSSGGSGAASAGIGSLAGSSNLGSNGEGMGNPPISTNNGGSGNATGNAGSGNASGSGGSTAAGGSANVGQGGSASMPQGGAGGTAPGNVGGTGGAQQPPIEEPPEPLPGGFYLIDDFEGGRDPAWTESEVGGGAGNFTLDTALGANGSSSSIRVDANNAFHTMLQFALPQAVRTANEVYGRVFLRLAANPSPAHYVWVEVGTTANDGQEMRLGHNVSRLQSNVWQNGSERDIRDRNLALVANTWYCLEFFMDNSPEQLRVWLDGEETALSTNNYTAGANGDGNTTPVTDFIPELQAFRIGWELQNGTVWFDDVALADAPVGCE